MSACYAYGTQGAEVEVDSETGAVRILRLVAVHDVGQVINPQTSKGQMYGALAQGLGYARLRGGADRERAHPQPGASATTRSRRACEMDFPIDLQFVETNDPNGPFGAKGVGEPGLVPTAPAIANAIYDAVGVRIHDLPITPAKVLEALNRQREH